MTTNFEQESARESDGKFGTQHNTAPEVSLTATPAVSPVRRKFNTLVESRTLNEAISALTLVDSSTREGMMVRVALIKHIENISPAIADWLENFYDGPDEDHCWKVDYADAILLAKDELGL
jgi:hypothetical protein